MGIFISVGRKIVDKTYFHFLLKFVFKKIRIRLKYRKISRRLNFTFYYVCARVHLNGLVVVTKLLSDNFLEPKGVYTWNLKCVVGQV